MPPSSQTAYQSLSAFKPRDTQTVLGEAENKYGIAERGQRLSSLRGLVGNLQSSVEAVDPSVTGRTSGTFTTEAQRQALVSRERAPILGDLAKQQSALGQEQAGYSEAQTLAGQLASSLINDDRQTYQRLLDQYNAAVASEKEAEDKRRFEAQMAAEQQRFEKQLAESRRTTAAAGYNVGGGGLDIASILKAATGQSAAPKNYIGNDDLRGRWAYQAKQGDNDAAVLLKYVGNDNVSHSIVTPGEYNVLKRYGVKGNYKAGNIKNAFGVTF